MKSYRSAIMCDVLCTYSMWQALDGVPAWIIGDVLPGIVVPRTFNYSIVTLNC